MKKLVVLTIVLMLVSILLADDRFPATISYYNDTITHFTRCPYTIAAGTYTVVATVFTPLAPVSLLNGFNVVFYQGTPPNGQVGNLDVKAEVWNVDPVTGLPTGMFPVASVTKPFAEIVWYTGTTYFDFASFNLSYAEGQKFALALSAPAAVVGTSWFTPMLNNTVMGHSYRWFSAGTSTGWLPYAGEYAMSASVEYDVPMQDVSAQSLWFTGDFFLPPGVTITYEADVINAGEVAHTNVPVYLEVYDLAVPATPIWSDVVYVDLPVSEDIVHIDTFDPYTYPLTPGEYKVVLRTALPTDMVPGNDEVVLEQQTVVLPDLFDYDNGVGDTAHAFYNAGDGWANSFWYYAEPVKLTHVSYNMRDNTWPSGAVGNEFMQIAVYGDDGTGAPGPALYGPVQVGCTLGAWNTYDISAANLTFAPDEKFWVAYIQVGNYPDCPGLIGDGAPPYASWSTSWYTVAGVWDSPNAYDEDMCIRAHVEGVAAPPNPPEVNLAIVGGDTQLSWNSVPGALSYNVYATPDPYSTWDYVETSTETSVTYVGTDPKNFFKVTASTNLDGTRAGKTSSKPAPAMVKTTSKENNIAKEIKLMQD